MAKSIYGLVSNKDQANTIVSNLLAAGISNNDISYLFPDKDTKWEKDKLSKVEYKPYGTSGAHGTTGAYGTSGAHATTGAYGTSGTHGTNDDYNNQNNRTEKLMTENSTKAPEGGVAGATSGGLLGGSLGLLAGIGALAIPGMGPFIAAGPIIAALSGSAIGGSLGMLIGSIIGAGIPEYEAKKYETGLNEGKILISVTTANDDLADRAYEIMEHGGATDLSTSSSSAEKS
ncbi:MAG: hypothetical protein H0W50_00070 [Parachlamydiaceae bacterium]|nr:hypothetical protein [Parachlamydiaceae bacterium]